MRKKEDRSNLSETAKEGYARRQRAFRARVKLDVMTHYSGGTPRCALCPDDVAFHALPFLCVDHIDGGGVQHRKQMLADGLGFGGIFKWLKKCGFPPGFRVLCHNHNWLEAKRLRELKNPPLEVLPARKPKKVLDTVELSGETRICKVHGEQPIEAYLRLKAYVYKEKQVWRYDCRLCDQAKSAARRSMAPEAYRQYLKDWRARNAAKVAGYQEKPRLDPVERQHERSSDHRRRRSLRDQVLDRYGRACACCGERDPDLLTLDHLGDGAEERRFNRLRGPTAQLRFVVKQGLPDGYQILCWNCNVAKLDSGACPHLTQSSL